MVATSLYLLTCLK